MSRVCGACRFAALCAIFAVWGVDALVRLAWYGGAMPVKKRAAWQNRWSRWALRAFGVRREIVGVAPVSGLLVCNHQSYLDILIFSASTCGCFISKSEVKGWPFCGWIARAGGCIFLDRKKFGASRGVNAIAAQTMRDGAMVVLFPEGTTGDSTQLLPFHTALYQSAMDAGVPVSAAAIRYELPGGDVRTDVCYWGEMEMMPHLKRLLTLKGITGTLIFADNAKFYANKREASKQTREIIESMLERPAVLSGR